MMRFLLALVVGLSLVGLAQEGVEELLSRAEAAYDRWHGEFDFPSYEGRLREAIQLWEKALPELSQPTEKRDILVKLSRAWFELAEGYLEEKEDAYAKGKDYALSALRLDPVFRETEGREGFRAALRKSTDVEALFGTEITSAAGFPITTGKHWWAGPVTFWQPLSGVLSLMRNTGRRGRTGPWPISLPRPRDFWAGILNAPKGSSLGQ